MASTATARVRSKASHTAGTLAAPSARQLREGMQARGYRRRMVWLPDTSKPQFATAYAVQLEKIAAHLREQADKGLIETTEEDLAGWV